MHENCLAPDLEHILQYTLPLWEELRGERLFISGGTGFFGCWLLESFAWANDRLGLGAKAVALTRSPERFMARSPHLARNSALTLLKGDIRTFEFPVGTFSHIIHAATETPLKAEPIDPPDMFRSNIEGTQRMLELADKCGAYKFLFTSSGAIYGKQPSEMTNIPEEYNGAPEPTDITSAYGQSKRACEFLCASAGSFSLQTKIARCFAFVGPRLPLNANYAIGNFIRDVLQGKPIQITGDGSPYRSYLYSADLAIWLWKILINGRHARPYNVGSDADLTIAQLAAEVVKTISPKLKVESAKHPLPDQPAQRYVPSIQRARSELDLDVWINLPDAIRRTANYYISKDRLCKL